MLSKTQAEVFLISAFLVNPYKQKSSNSRTSTDIDMKLGPVAKLGNRNTGMPKKFWLWIHVGKMSFFQFIANLEQSESQIPDSWSVKLTFSLIVTFWATSTGFEWLSVHLRTKWLWVRIPLLSLKLQILRLFWPSSSLTSRQL